MELHHTRPKVVVFRNIHDAADRSRFWRSLGKKFVTILMTVQEQMRFVTNCQPRAS